MSKGRFPFQIKSKGGAVPPVKSAVVPPGFDYSKLKKAGHDTGKGGARRQAAALRTSG